MNKTKIIDANTHEKICDAFITDEINDENYSYVYIDGKQWVPAIFEGNDLLVSDLTTIQNLRVV